MLENIDKNGSISAAGRAMDMSYKRAWDLVDEINRICRQAAVERQTGGKNGGGAVLTAFGISLVTRYRKIERDAASAARKELQALRQRDRRVRRSARVEFIGQWRLMTSHAVSCMVADTYRADE